MIPHLVARGNTFTSRLSASAVFTVAGRFGLSDRAELTDEVQHSRRVFRFLHCGGAVVEVEVPRSQLHALVDEDLDGHGHKVCGRSQRERFKKCGAIRLMLVLQFIIELVPLKRKRDT